MYLAKAAAGAPTSVGTAGTIGQIIRYGGVLYFCSVTGAAGPRQVAAAKVRVTTTGTPERVTATTRAGRV